jgi:hypothetical protein
MVGVAVASARVVGSGVLVGMGVGVPSGKKPNLRSISNSTSVSEIVIPSRFASCLMIKSSIISFKI